MRIPDLEGQSDEDLVRAFVDGGDRDALEVLLRRHQSRVFGIACRVLGNRADALDASQDVFVGLFRKAGSFKGEAAFTTWLYRLTVNACHDLLRKRARTPEPVETVESPVEDQAGRTDDRLVVEAALRALPEDQRTAVVMRDLYGLAYEEIAGAAGVPVGTVKSRIARGRAALAEAMRERAGDPGRLTGQ